MEDHNWKTQFEAELARAEQARASGNEGMARVCARRAAGLVIGEFLRQRKLTAPGGSAYDRLRYLVTLPELEPDAREIAQHFLLRITPEHVLPVEADLIAETRWLANKLLN